MRGQICICMKVAELSGLWGEKKGVCQKEENSVRFASFALQLKIPAVDQSRHLRREKCAGGSGRNFGGVHYGTGEEFGSGYDGTRGGAWGYIGCDWTGVWGRYAGDLCRRAGGGNALWLLDGQCGGEMGCLDSGLSAFHVSVLSCGPRTVAQAACAEGYNGWGGPTHLTGSNLGAGRFWVAGEESENLQLPPLLFLPMLHVANR